MLLTLPTTYERAGLLHALQQWMLPIFKDFEIIWVKKYHFVSVEILKEENFLFSCSYSNIHKPLQKHIHILFYTLGYVILENSSLSLGVCVEGG